MQRPGIEAVRYEKRSLEVPVLKLKPRAGIEKVFLAVIFAAALVYSAVVIIPIIALIQSSGAKGIASAAGNTNNIYALGLSLLTSTLTLVLVFVTGTPLVYFMTRAKTGILTRIFEILIGIPTVLPPAVAGIALLLAFGRDGFMGRLLGRFDIEVVFTPFAVMIAQFFIAAGLYVQVLKNGVDSVSRDVIDAAYVFGAGKLEAYVRVVLPMLGKTIASGLVLSWTRALGEFGATIMFAGNVLGRTRTVPLQIYTLMQTDTRLAASLSVIMLLISSLMLFMTKLLLKENRM